VVLLAEPGERPAGMDDAPLLPRDADVARLREAIDAGLSRPRAVLSGD
jgi:hypothetical protein